MSRRNHFGPTLRLVGGILGATLFTEHLVAQLGSASRVPTLLVLALAFAGWALPRRQDLARRLRRVETSVILLFVFGLACTTGSFLLQVRDLEVRNLHGAEARRAFRMAEAEFLHRLVGGSNLTVPLAQDLEEQLARDAAELGAEVAERRRKAWIRQHQEEYRTREVEAFAVEYAGVLDALEFFAWVTRLEDVYRSWWFFALMVLLGTSLLSAVSRRLSPQLDRVPFLATHLGFVLLIVGFGVSRFSSQRGRLPLRVGQTLDRVSAAVTGEVDADLGFPVELGAFYAEARTKLAVQIDGPHGAPPARSLVDTRPGQVHEFSGGKYRVEVVDAAPYGVAAPRVVPAQPGTPGPAALEVRLGDAGGARKGWLFATKDRRAWLTGAEEDFALTFHWDDPAAWLPAERDAWGVLELSPPGGTTQRLPALVGATTTVDDKVVRVAEVCTDFARRRLAMADQPRTNPAVRLEIEGPDGASVTRWSFAWVDFDSMHEPAFPELKVRYHFAPGDLGPERQFRLLGDASGVRLVRFDAAGTPQAEALGEGVELDLGSRHLSLAVEQVHAAARQELEVLPLTERQLRTQEGAEGGHDHAGDDLFSTLSPTTHRLFHPPGPPAVKLRITHPGGQEERWFLADTSGAAGWSDGRFHMAFGTRPDDVAEWRSLLVVGEGEAAERHVVRVNHPLHYRGWTLYQHDADPKRPDYSGILAVYDPGWPLVAVALILVSFGVAGMFWVQPFLRRRPGVERRRP